MKDIPMLREKQIEQLAFYIHNEKCLDLSDPGTGKTPPCCVYSFMMWDRGQKKTLWSMPKSLLKKNKKEMIRFTEFEDNDVAIMRNDRADMSKNWTGPTVQSTRTRRGYRCRLPGAAQPTDTVELRDLAGQPVKFCYRKLLPVPYGPPAAEWVTLAHNIKREPGYCRCPGLLVEPICGPDGEPVKMTRSDPEIFKDLIVDAVQKGAKVFICTFSFMSAHWERLIKAAPDIDLLLVDELHMGYGGSESKQTESFYWVNRHVSRFVGMTGTLINGRLDSAYPALSVIEPRYYGSLQGFYFEHAAVVDDYGRVVVWKNEAKLSAIIAKHSIRRTFEEVYGKEDVVFFTEYVEMEEKVRAKYDQFESQALLELSDGRVIDGSMPGVNAIRCRQIMGHPETMGLGEIEPWTAKDDRLTIHLGTGKKALIFASLKPEQERIKRLCQSLGLRTEIINSDVQAKDRERIDELAQRHEVDVIVASGPTVAVGFNWEMFDLVIFASIDYQDVNILQAYRRASRGTRTKTLHVIFVRYEDCGVEDRMYDIVTAKSQLANRVDATRPVLAFSAG